jgi:hypothetical protein
MFSSVPTTALAANGSVHNEHLTRDDLELTIVGRDESVRKTERRDDALPDDGLALEESHAVSSNNATIAASCG